MLQRVSHLDDRAATILCLGFVVKVLDELLVVQDPLRSADVKCNAQRNLWQGTNHHVCSVNSTKVTILETQLVHRVHQCHDSMALVC